MMNSTPLTAEQLCEVATIAHAREDFSPFGNQTFLIADLRAPNTQPHALSQMELQRTASFLANLPCPTIAISAEHPLNAAFDIIVATPDDTNVLLTNISRAPIAAMTLVQVLRCTEHMSMAEGLLLESLAYATLQSGPEFNAWSEANPPMPVIIDSNEPALIIERTQNVLTAKLNRAERRNAISVELRDALTELFQLVNSDQSISRVKISGNGACFSIGGDIDEFGTAPNPATAHAIRSVRLPARYLINCIDRVEFHVHSACIGAGAEIPAFAKYVSASRSTFFQLPEINFGLIPGAGGCVSIPKRIGRQRATYMALSAKKINAKTALQWGLVDEIID